MGPDECAFNSGSLDYQHRGISLRQSSEVPMESLVPMLTFAALHDELSAAECADIITALAASIKRQHP